MTKIISFPQQKLIRSAARSALRANDLDSLNAEIWAREALLQLEYDLLMPNISFVDFSDQVGKWGDVVNVNTIGTFTGQRKGAKCEDIVQQDATAGQFQVELNQFPYVSFAICDGEEDRPVRDLIRTYMNPAVRALTEMIDQIVAGQHIRFWNNFGGHLEGLTEDNSDDYVLETREKMTLNRIPVNGRNLILGPRSERPFLKNELYVAADKSGSTRTLRQGEIGRLYNMDVWSSYVQPFVDRGSLTFVTAAVNHTNGYNAGDTSIVVDAASGTIPAGSWVVIAGDDVPQHVLTSNVASAAGTITISPGLRRAVADNAVLRTVATGAAVNGNYAGPVTSPAKKYGWAKRIRVDGVPTSQTPQVGQVVSFSTATDLYSMIQVFNTDVDGAALGSGVFEIVLDRPLDAALANDVSANFGPAGSFNMAYSKEALTIAIRPLPRPRTGTLSSVVNSNGLSIRTVISYDAKKQAHIVTLDLLFGIGLYREEAGAVMFA